jgi:D-sedoheptulose 7-phosphate isomerase
MDIETMNKTKNNLIISSRISELKALLLNFESKCDNQLILAAELISRAVTSGRKILICGNGGSAADSQHFAAELVSSYSKTVSRRAISAIALTTDTSILTAFSNDFSFEKVFMRQVEAHGNPNDVLIVITTSGKSKNCLWAVRQAKVMGLKTIALTSTDAEVSKEVDVSIEVPSADTQHIQECHMVAYHILSELIENAILEKVDV